MSVQFKFEAIGTTWNIDIPVEISADKEVSLLDAIKNRIDVFDKAYSRFRPDSIVSAIAQKAGEYHFPDDAEPMMKLYREMYDITGGLMTPLVGQVLVDAGYDATYSLQPKATIPKAIAWDDVMIYSHPILITKEPVVLDFGAIGKGYLIDIVAGVIRQQGITEYTVDAGGDIAHHGGLLRVGLEDPQNTAKALGIMELGDRSLCGSAGNKRVWDRFHHIINPKTIESPRHILGLWTMADTTMLADALSTALFFVGPEKLSRYQFDYALVQADRSALISKGFQGSLFEI
jgi:thiamine biosynthesis lipoprotein